MQQFEGFGFTIGADGSFKRTVRIDQATRKQTRQALEDANSVIRDIGASVSANGRAMTTEESSAFEAVKVFKADAARRLAHLDGASDAVLREDDPSPDGDTEASARALAAAGLPGLSPLAGWRQRTDRPSHRTHASVFGRASRAGDTGGWNDPGELFRVLSRGLNDSRLRAAGQGGESDPVGGYAVPVATEVRIFDGAVPASIFLSRANVQPMKARTQQVATFDRSGDGTAGTMFGLGFEFIPEGGNGASVQTAELRMIEMNARTRSDSVRFVE